MQKVATNAWLKFFSSVLLAHQLIGVKPGSKPVSGVIDKKSLKLKRNGLLKLKMRLASVHGWDDGRV
jgi:hypothetical protein